MRKALAQAFLTAAVFAVPSTAAGDEPAWIAPMKKAHERFGGKPGTLALFGDSITVSMAFWAPLRWEPKNMPDEMAAALGLAREYMRPECWSDWRGPKYGNNGGMTIRWAHENVARWLKDLNPEVAVILFGTNDLGQLGVEEFEKRTAEVVDHCLDNGTVVILTTLPPRSGALDKAKQFAEAARRVARDRKVPLIDYQAECLKRRPDDWDGAMPKFKDVPGSEYDVPTLIARDGVHPSNPRAYQDYADESLSKNGFALRSTMTLLAYADVIRKVLPSEQAATKALRKAATFYASFDEAVKADRGAGLELSTRFTHETEKNRYVFDKGFDTGVFRVAPDKGVQGGALEVVDVLPRNGRVFFPARGNLAYRKGGWGGAVSVWLNTNPNRTLKTKFCDPIQITQKGSNNGGIWFDFNDAHPRDLRHGAFPALVEGEVAIKEEDARAPMVRVPGINWKSGAWHHVVLSWRNFDTGKTDAVSALFIDGKMMGEVKDRALAMNWDIDKTGVYIAVNYIGLLDELSLFGRSLTDDEVTLLYRRPGAPAGSSR